MRSPHPDKIQLNNEDGYQKLWLTQRHILSEQTHLDIQLSIQDGGQELWRLAKLEKVVCAVDEHPAREEGGHLLLVAHLEADENSVRHHAVNGCRNRAYLLSI